MAEGLRGVGRQLGIAQVSSYGNYSDVGSYGGNGYYRSGTAQEAQNREVASAKRGPRALDGDAADRERHGEDAAK